jgi:hypothetical protein
MPYQLGSAPPGLRGFLLSRANQQAEQQAEMQGIQGLLALQLKHEQLRQAAQNAPLEQALLKAKVDAIPVEQQLRAAQIAEAQRKTQQGEIQSQAQMGLAALLSRPYQGEGPAPDAVVTSDAQAIEMLKAANGKPMRVDVPNPATMQSLSVLANPGSAIPALIRAQNQRPTVLNPGAGLVPPGATAPVYTQPYNPKAEPLVVVQGEGGPKYVRRSEAEGKTPGAKPGTGGAAGGDSIDFTPEALDLRAYQYLSGNPQAFTNLGRGAQGANRIVQITNRAAEILKAQGGDPKEIGRRLAEYKANSASLSQMTRSYDAITAFEQTAVRNGEILIELADKVDRSGVPVIERWVRAGRQATGDPDVAKFNAQLQVYRTEAARILTNPNLSGQLTDSARKEIEEFLKPGASAQQIKSVVHLLKRDFDNRRKTLEGQIDAARERLEKNIPAGQGQRGNTTEPSTGGGWSIRPLP